MATKKFVPKILNRVTLPFLKMDQNKPIYIKITKPLYMGKQIDPKKEAATMIQGFEYQRGELVEMIAGIVLQNELETVYPNGSYVGKCFEFVLHKSDKPNKNGQLTNLYNISEIGEPNESDFAVETIDTATGEIVEKTPAELVASADAPATKEEVKTAKAKK